MSIPNTPIISTSRIELYYPIERFDAQARELLLDKEIIQHISFLFDVASDDERFKTRRENHRKDAKEGKGAMFDLIDTKTGNVIGSSGFREIDYDNKSGEFGIIVKKEWQRKGVCSEVHDACISWARENGLVKATAFTSPGNEAMLAFFRKNNWKRGSSQCDFQNWVNMELEL
eukprot:CFRG0885T1